MSAVTGTFRNGKIELHGPPPADWVDGTEVSVSASQQPNQDVDFCIPPPAGVRPELPNRELPFEDIDLTGDSPEAIAAWIKWMEELHKLTAGSTFPEELEAFLAEQKKEELALWDKTCKRIDGLFQ